MYFTTFFDRNYLSRGLILYQSLKEYCDSFELYVLCLDTETYNFFESNRKRFPEIRWISLEELEKADNELKKCKKNRSVVEYYFTLSPCLPLFVLTKYKLSHICSLDADLMFFSSPAPLFALLDTHSVLITPHNYSPELKGHEVYGLYNVSFQIFKNDKWGVNCLEHWRAQCIDWCYDRLEDGKFADQKYLDDWPYLFEGVLPINHKGIGVAPWNVASYSISRSGKHVFVDQEKLIFYHYQGLRIIGEKLFKHGLKDYMSAITEPIKQLIYKPYIKALLQQEVGTDRSVIRNQTQEYSLLKTVLFQQDWLYFRCGIVYSSNVMTSFLGKVFIKWKKLIHS